MSYQFHGQRPNEDVLLIVRRHPFVLLHPFLIATLVLLIPYAVYVITPVGYILSISIVAALIIACSIVGTAYHSWSHTLFLLTNERVVYLAQHGLVRREFVECSLSTIQRVSHTIKGILGTTWGYGTISIATGGVQGMIEVPDIPDPYEIQQEIQTAAAGGEAALTSVVN